MKQTKYSSELIEELEKLFPDYTQAIKLAKENSPFLKQYIQGSYLTSIHADKIILATSLEDLQKEAFLIKRRINFEKKLLEEHSNIFQS